MSSDALSKLRSKMVQLNVVSGLRSQKKKSVSTEVLLRSAQVARDTFTDEELAKVRHDILQRANT